MAKRHAEPYRLFKRGDIWHAYISLVLETGERIQLRETTGAVSEQKAVEYCLKRIEQIQKKARSQTTGELPSITVDEAFARYFVEKGRFLSLPKQRLTRLNKLKNDIEAVLLNEITEPKINKFITENKPYLSNSTINRYLFLLSAVIKTAKEEWRVKTPDFKISKFKLREPAENIKYLKDWSAAQKIIDRAAPHLKPIIYTALYTGLRESNILNLKWQDIDFKSQTITIKVKDSTREGGKTHTIPIIDKLSDILNSLPKNSEYVFTYNNKPIKSISTAWRNIFYKRNTRKSFSKQLRDADLPYINFHTLRHTAATWILKKTNNLRVTKEILGHANINTTLKYAHILDDEKRGALNAVFK